MWFLIWTGAAALGVTSILEAAQPARKLSPIQTGSSASSPSKLTITPNPDGTLTVHKEPPPIPVKGKSTQGLVIHPQIISPVTPPPKNNPLR